MTHREHVIKALKEAIPFIHSRGYGSVAEIMHDALDLLEEQEAVVRCKDCKHWRTQKILNYRICDRWKNQGIKNFATSGDWFCADGERK